MRLAGSGPLVHDVLTGRRLTKRDGTVESGEEVHTPWWAVACGAEQPERVPAYPTGAERAIVRVWLRRP